MKLEALEMDGEGNLLLMKRVVAFVVVLAVVENEDLLEIAIAIAIAIKFEIVDTVGGDR